MCVSHVSSWEDAGDGLVLDVSQAPPLAQCDLGRGA